jgi:dienelactone hydrolase
MKALPRRAGAFTLAAVVFAVAAWQSGRPVCRGCRIEEVRLTTANRTSIRARFYLPPHAAVRLPAVIVCHGYLANLAFMEVPWAQDIARLGIASLFLDRRGHGGSAGSLWPRHVAAADDGLAADEDIAAGIDFLRAYPSIDATRLAVLGHSDGASAAIVAGSADWSLRATVALSASVAPWQLVNHAAPQNLLLAYGTDDRFVLRDTDALLIDAATRGYLDGPGMVGRLDDGSARRLLRIAGRGHVDLIYSRAARRAVLDWLGGALGAARPVTLSSPRRAWPALGAVALLALLASAPSRSGHPGGVGPRSATLRPWRILAVALGGVGTALLASRLVRHLGFVPGQQTSVVAALLISGTAMLAGGGAVQAAWRAIGERRARPVAASVSVSGTGPASIREVRARQGGPVLARHPQRGAGLRAALLDAAWGAGLGLAVAAGLFVLLRHLYDAPLSPPRALLMMIVAGLALPCFAALERCLAWTGRGAHRVVPALTLVLLAVVIAAASPLLFERMAVLPVYVFAAVLLAIAAHRVGDPTAPPATGAAMATLLLARLSASVSTLY